MPSRTVVDACLVVDWSANGTPKTGKDSIWIAEVVRVRGRLQLVEPRNPPTRQAAYDLILQSLSRHVAAKRRVLLGFDFAYTFPRGFADALGLDGSDARWLRVWRALTERIHDGASNANNRWDIAAALNRRLGHAPGPFWNCPRGAATADLRVTKGAFPHVVRGGTGLPEYRFVDQALRGSGRIVQSVWKLFTTGSVGSQTLLGIPRVHALRRERDWAPWSRVWPFETGFTREPSPRSGPFILHAEVWPGIVPDLSGDGSLVRDARQVITLAQHFAHLDGAGKLAPLFERPAALTAAESRICCDEEGWTLGA